MHRNLQQLGKPNDKVSMPQEPTLDEVAKDLREQDIETDQEVRELVGQRQAAGLSQTEVAARMGTSQSAVARLEAGTTDVRTSTLERYAAAVGGQITWKLDRPAEGVSE